MIHKKEPDMISARIVIGKMIGQPIFIPIVPSIKVVYLITGRGFVKILIDIIWINGSNNAVLRTIFEFLIWPNKLKILIRLM